MPPTSPPNRHAPPHIRINSGNHDHRQGRQQPASKAQTSRQQDPRSLMSQQPSSRPLYQSQTPAESSELLLPPRKGNMKPRRFQDDESVRSPTPASGNNSRRTSWSSGSDRSRDRKIFDDSRAPSRAESDDEGVNTQTVSEKYNIMPSAGLLLFPEDVEKDDWLHTPDPNDRDKMQWSDLFSTRGLVNVGGLAFLVMGILILFIGYPVL